MDASLPLTTEEVDGGRWTVDGGLLETRSADETRSEVRKEMRGRGRRWLGFHEGEDERDE